jgi:HEAT repeat protein
MRLIKVATLIAILMAMVVGGVHRMSRQGHRNEIDSLLKRLSLVVAKEGNNVFTTAPSIETQQDVHDSLLRIADQTPELRSEVIEALLRVLEDPEAGKEAPVAYRWTTAVNVIGELRATEAIDILIKNLNRTGENGLVSSIHYHPVARALAKIGEPAIPQLIEVLSSSDEDISYQAELAIVNMGEPAKAKMQEALFQGDAGTRGRAALVLAWIGGEDSRATIEGAFARERDPAVLKELEAALREMHRVWGGAESRTIR